MKTIYFLLLFVPVAMFAQLNQPIDRLTGTEYYSSFYTTPQTPEAEMPLSPGAAFGFKAFPNPFHQIVYFEFATELMGTALLEIYDPYGQLVAIYRYELLPGKNLMAWDPASDSKDLQEGMYIYSLTIGNSVYRGKLQHDE
ncbi:MAG: T9SS type A sorting domain-containing protein [Chitinophagales bacterium]|nr:T9SS type A sorting domain-containing protein [Chitinophagales bacterium]